jgi:hypothetical protein
MPPSPSPVTVNITVNVSVNGVPVVGMSPEPIPAAHLAHGKVGLASVSPFNITIPASQGSPGVLTARVRIDSLPGGLKTICSKGTLNVSAPCVFAKVVQGTVPSPDPGTPPPSCDPLLRMSPTDPNNNWCWEFSRRLGNELPGADCNASGPGAANTLILWALLDEATQYTSQAFPFVGVCSNQTDCDGASSPLATAVFPMLAARPHVPPAVLVGTVRDKTGCFTSLPDEIAFAWDDRHHLWVGAESGFTLTSQGGEILLSGPAGARIYRASRGCCSGAPLHVIFNVDQPADAPGGAGSFRLDVTE